MRPVTWTLPFGEPCTFIPAGCLHWPLGEKDLLDGWIKSVGRAENGFTILMGDSTDAFRTHARQHLKGYTVDENSLEAIDEWHRRDVRELAEKLRPIKHRIAGVLLGNHYHTHLDGTNSEQYLCSLLGLRYLGPVGFVRLDFRDKRQVRHHTTIFAHHHGGSQGGRTAGGDPNALTRMEAGFDADVYVLSHTHRRYAHREQSLGITSKGDPRPISRDKVLIRAGAFLKGFAEDVPATDRIHTPSYAELKALRPTDLGWVTLHLKATQVSPDRTSRKSQGLAFAPITRCEMRVEY